MSSSKFKLCLGFLLVILSPKSAFANGGIPLWINTIQTVAASAGISALGNIQSGLTITLICLALVICIETLFLAKRYFKTTSRGLLIKAVTVSNLLSTILGGIFMWGAFYIALFFAHSHALGYLLLGPLYGIIDGFSHNSITVYLGVIFILTFYNAFFCIFSYYIERFVVKKYLQQTYSPDVISKGVLRANILSYFISFFLMLPIYMFLINIL